MKKYSDKSVVFIIPEKNFHDHEFKIPKEILEKNGYRTFVASESLNFATGHFGLKIKPEIYLYNLHPENFSAIILIGGHGTRALWNNLILHKILQRFYKQKKILAAICSGVGILASAELLKGKKATCFVNDIEFIKSSGAIYTGNLIETDNNIVTAAGPHTSEVFGQEIANLLNKGKNL